MKFLLVLCVLVVLISFCRADGNMNTTAWSAMYVLPFSLIVAADTTNNALLLIDVGTKTTLIEVLLNGQPLSMAYDQDYNEFYVTFLANNNIARVNVLGASVHYIFLACAPVSIAVSSSNIYALCQSNMFPYVIVLDKFNEKVITTVPVDFLSSTIVASWDQNFFITASLSTSTSQGMFRYEYSMSIKNWTLAQEGVDAENGNTLVLSPDSKHALLVCGGGNGLGYSIIDYNSMDFTVSYGAFATGAYPTGGSYSSDQKLFATANYDSVLVFDSQRYTITHKYPLTKSDPYFQLQSVGLASGVCYSYALTGFDENAGFLQWWTTDDKGALQS